MPVDAPLLSHLVEAPDRPTLLDPTPTPAGMSAELASLATRLLDQLDRESKVWAEALRQDAIESAPRLGWWHQIRRGVRLPIRDLYLSHAGRLSVRLARQFVEEGAAIRAAHTGEGLPRLILAGQGRVRPLEVADRAVDPTIHRLWNEAELPWRQRFDRELVAAVANVHQQILRAHLSATITDIERIWQGSEP